MWLTVAIIVFYIGIGCAVMTNFARGDWDLDEDGFPKYSGIDQKDVADDPFEFALIMILAVFIWPLAMRWMKEQKNDQTTTDR
jgi:hypothetical protein